jgi:hypothetical protein
MTQARSPLARLAGHSVLPAQKTSPDPVVDAVAYLMDVIIPAP